MHSYNLRQRQNFQNDIKKVKHSYNLRKRRNDQNEIVSPIKRRAIEAITYGNKQQSTLDTLNFDCLEQIFMHLNSYELISLVEASEKFKDAATYAYIQKYGDTLNIKYHSSIEYYKRVMRCFGHAIKKLNLEHIFFDIRAFQCFEAIVDNCGQNLLELKLTYAKPCWYPPNEEGIYRCIPSLKHLTIEMYYSSIPILVRFIKLNPQLETLTIEGQYMTISNRSLRFISANLPQLKGMHFENLTFHQRNWKRGLKKKLRISTSKCIFF